MTAIVAGQGLGLSNTSLGLGTAGQTGSAGQGGAGEQVYVNAGTGNLVVQRQDEWMVELGPDVGLLRTYNSQGGVDYDNGDQWRIGFSRRIWGLSGTLNGSGSSIRRVDDDGLERTYAYDGTAYVATAGAGAHDTLNWDGSKWTWTDGDTRIQETYEAAATAGQYRLKTVTDLDNKSLTLAYTADLLTQLTASSGEVLYIDYYTGTSDVMRMRTQGATGPRTTYAYDSAHRLSSVTIDLTPATTTDSVTYTTTYTYTSSTSKLLKTIEQTDGSKLQFDYDASDRIVSVIDVRDADLTRITTFDYGTAGQTVVTDADGQKTEYSYLTSGANSGQLSGVAWKAAGGTAPCCRTSPSTTTRRATSPA